jgi:hypothetical protein
MSFSRFVVLLLILAVGYTCAAQNLKIRNIELRDTRLVLHYDLLDSVEGRFYSIRAYSSTDSYLNPLEKVNGDIGLEVKPGMDKIIEWDFRNELPAAYDGKVSVEVRGRIFIPFINVQSINQYKIFKRKRRYNITWTGGTPQNVLNFDLFNGDKKVYTFPNLANVGHYALEFPSHISPDKNYRLRISDTKNKEEVVLTEKFRIKRKVPLLLKVIPAGLVGFGIYFFIKPKPVQDADKPIVGAPNPREGI